MAYTDIDDPSAYFQTALYTGDNANTKAVTFDGNSNMQPDLWWGKTRSTARNHNLIDSIRGVTKTLQSDVTSAELSSDSSGFLASFNSNGFTTQKGSYDNGNVNISDRTYVNWCWAAGTAFTNDASSTSVGSIDSAGSVNTDAGFSIISYTGTGSNGTIAHGLGAKPDMILIKNRSNGQQWSSYWSPLGATKYMRFATTNAVATASNRFANTEPTTSVFTVSTDGEVNEDGLDLIAYCFTNIQGYSKVGSYAANENTDGTFIYLGFKPAWIMLKQSNLARDWHMFDNKRSSFNAVSKYLRPNEAGAEDSGEEYVDFLSNGFKIKNTGNRFNDADGTYIYMAFAEQPFVTSTGVPATAR